MSLAEDHAALDLLFGGPDPDEPLPDSGAGMWLASYQSPKGLRWHLCSSGGEVARLSAPSPGTTITAEWITGARLDDLLDLQAATWEAQERTTEMEGYQR